MGNNMHTIRFRTFMVSSKLSKRTHAGNNNELATQLARRVKQFRCYEVKKRSEKASSHRELNPGQSLP